MSAPTSHVNRVAEWARDEGLDRAAAIARLVEEGMTRHYALFVTREAAELHNLGWPVNMSRNAAERKTQAAERLQALRAQGVRRKDAFAAITAEFNLKETAIGYICSAHNIRWPGTRGYDGNKRAPEEKPAIVQPPAPVPTDAPPPAAHDLAQRILADLADELNPVATPCEYATGFSSSAWGCAACWGNPATIILAHDYDDFRRQVAGDAPRVIHFRRRQLQEAGD